MTVYVALLRGINVSGKKTMKMDSLKALFESMQFQQVRTYIQSGNVVFAAAESTLPFLREKIETGIRSAYGFDVTVTIRSSAELAHVILSNPFAQKSTSENGKLYVTFLADEPNVEAIRQFETYRDETDEFRVLSREVYILCRQGYGNAKLSNAFIEKKLKVPATTRNWETVNTLAAMAGEALN